MINNKYDNRAFGAYGANGLYGLYGLCGLHGLHGLRRARLSFIIYHLLFIISIIISAPASAQIIVGGNVYGGGNAANVAGSTKVTVQKGDLNKVFGGARMANVGGNTFVNIDGENASGDIMITTVYGGNDISGTIGTAATVGETLPAELTEVLTGAETKETNPEKNAIDDTWNVYLRTSRSTKDDGAGNTIENYPIIVGDFFGGGNGDFTYLDENGDSLRDESGNYLAKEGDNVVAISRTPLNTPNIAKTYLEINGGDIAHLYGGGNNATVTENTTLSINNTSSDLETVSAQYVADVIAAGGEITFEEVFAYLLAKVKLNIFQTNLTNYRYNFARIFGGNNKAEMAIRPTWNLRNGIVRDLYSGGNRGSMTCPEGLLVEIPEGSNISIYNLYGGCRMADVRPTVNGEYTPCLNLTRANYPTSNLTRDYNFPNELSARTLVRGGTITNVYGGNDITGKVFGGNAVGIYSSIEGDVYGGGNGAYAYTDNETLGSDATYNDFYYSLGEGDLAYSPRALNAHRPNAEQVSIRLAGTDAMHPTIIRGGVYCGGNCASIATKKYNPLLELKIGSHVIADQVFLGNNGAGMVDVTTLNYYASEGFSTISMTNASEFADYMEGVAMNLQPSVVFDQTSNGDPANYVDNTSYVGSFFCGGNLGSMAIPGKNTYRIDRGLNIFNKFVGGCNSAYVPAGTNNAAYDGGVLGSSDERASYTDGAGNIKDRLDINLDNLTITPLRWHNAETKDYLVWNTNKWQTVYTAVEEGTTLTADKTYYTSDTGTGEFTATGSEVADEEHHYYEKGEDFVAVSRDPSDHDIRLLDGNVYGGCYNSGHVNGNVVININEDVIQREEIFGTGPSRFGKVASGVELLDQRDDVMAVALSVFGGGCGEGTEIWGSSTVNLNNGYAFQLFGGGEEGIVGKKKFDVNGIPVLDEDDHFVYEYDPAYSTFVNLNGASPIYSSTDDAEDLAETEYIYGGGNEGDVCGNTYVNLGNGRIYDAFGGASDADILGHTEVYIGRQPKGDGTYKDGFPWIRDVVYGGNDFGGTVHGAYEDGYDFTARIKDYDATKAASLHGTPTGEAPGVLQSSAYVEYLQGRVDTIYGGNYGYYDYSLEMYEGATMPTLESTFVNIRPKANDNNALKGIFGGGTGYPKEREGDTTQDRSYVLIDIPDGTDKFAATEVFGAGAYNGLGMRFNPAETMLPSFDPDQLSAVIDLLHGQVGNAYGGSYNEGVTVRTVVNVPAASTINIGNIFGGAYGTQILPPCDVFESNVNYNNTSENARVTGNIYGGNNNERRTLYTHVNISSPVWQNKEKGYLARIYGAGKGIDTWSEYTDVNLNSGAKVYEAYGGGQQGHVLNAESVQKYMQLYKDKPSAQISAQDPLWSQAERWTGAVGTSSVAAAYTEAWAADWEDAWKLGSYYEPNATYTNYADNALTNLTNDAIVTNVAEMDDRDYSAYSTAEKAKRFKRYNTNVRIHEGATVVNYAYGGGWGDGTHLSGDVYGTTYIALLGGTVNKDIYAAGTSGAVADLFAVGAYDASTNPTGFTASANAYVKGGSCRNVYGGGWKGDVGLHRHPDTYAQTEDITIAPTADIPGETHVVIGDLAGTSFTNGIPTIQRNAYGGGEGEPEVNGGMIFGTAHLTLNNGYVGYLYNADGSDDPETTGFDERYEEKIEDETRDKPNTFLTEAGCLFGGGYTDNSYVDKTVVNIYGGHVRNCAFGGGEVAAIGRGDMKEKAGGSDYELKGIYRPGKTLIEMYGGQVHENVYGGGRGFDNLSRVGTLHSSGFVFGQTEVHIHGGEIGTVAGVADGDGNVFGGGDVGHVYSAYENETSDVATYGPFGWGVKSGERYGNQYQGYYYKHRWENRTDAEDQFLHENVSERIFTEDCKVLVEPHLKVTSPVTIDRAYAIGEYVPTSALNQLKNKDADAARWNCLDATGIIIHNAVFAGGNTPAGSMVTSANSASVFGNATASIHDVFHRDMITLGTRHTGGLYGDGNLTLVDGYRELNITNYGTDYYSISPEITIDQYHALPDREADYYELRYTCLKDCEDKEDTRYKASTGEGVEKTKASTITADEMQSLFVQEVKNAQGETVLDEHGNPTYESVKDGDTPILIYNSATGEWVPNPNGGDPYWEESGVVPAYAGRLMNSIQRADFCGVFGSRMVMQGAKDRVPDEADYTNYTINRVREVSLNKKESVITSDLAIDPSSSEYYKFHTHGNYFGIYNIVNYLGALTSDVDFGSETTGSIRSTDNSDATTYKCAANGKGYGTATYYDWKKQFIHERKRNNGSSYNKVALASGVYLELTTEESTGTGLYEKVWGPITGVVELDLINVSTGIGGGFVYAKNQHGVRTPSGHTNTTLTTLNDDAVTQWDFNYDTTEDSEHQKEWESSGNFVHSTQTIIDDCYNISNRYMGAGKMPAHYWYIKGSTYVYDQYISAYTGTTNAYSETVDIPLTIAAASHGKMKLLNVQPNLYAYYASPGVKLESGKRIVINDKSYYANDPISYWDWFLLSKAEQALFVPETYTNCMTYKLDGVEHAAGTVFMTPAEYTAFMDDDHEYFTADDEPILDGNKQAADDDYIFRLSNNVSHDKGYLLTYEVNNPSKWDNWYTLKSGSYTAKKTLAEYEAMDAVTKATYYDGPTFRIDPSCLEGGESGKLLGQRFYKEGALISKDVYDTYDAIVNKPATGQATFVPAYLVTSKITVTDPSTGKETHYNEGVAVSQAFADAHSSSTEAAYICTSSIQLTKENVIYRDSKVTASERTAYITDVEDKMDNLRADSHGLTLDAIKALATDGSFTAEKKKQLIEMATLRDDLTNNLVLAYYCTTPEGGLYGGNFYESGKNYRGLEAWSSLSEADHDKFIYNYDALDLLVDPTYSRTEGQKYQYDGAYTSEDEVRDADTGNKAGYSVTQPVDYTASYNDDEHTLEVAEMTVNRGGTPTTTTTLQDGDELTRDQFESLPNEQRHFAPVAVKGAGTYYVVNTAFQVGSTPYAVGEVISSESYLSLPGTEQGYVTALTTSKAEHENVTLYYCRETYDGSVTAISSSDITGAGAGVVGGKVQKGTLILKSQYDALTNQQKNFTIHGVSPTETSTLYVSRESDIYDLSKEKIITVIYQYDYDETDGTGNVTPVSERHVVNIHLTFRSGVPTVEDIDQPGIILPGDFITLREPTVTPGAYEITGGGWELFESQRDAESHSNGVDYDPNFDPLYWYQDGHYVAYYAKSYLGRTYSNAVPVSVANYHDLKKVMDDKDNHYYIDNANVKRYPKIYINDYSGNTPEQNGLDLFKNLYDLSVLDGSPVEGYTFTDGKITAAAAPANTALVDHTLLNSRVKAGQRLEFFLRTDINHGTKPNPDYDAEDLESPARIAAPWTPIASGVSDPCFEGVLHGDGHTLSGLDHSLFGKLCGSVYNLGVTGSFNTAGVADTGDGYVESCWVKTTATTPLGSKPYAVFGDPTASSGYQVVNSYFGNSNKGLYQISGDDADVVDYQETITSGLAARGLATAMSDSAFYNGTLAYDLNNFYLYKRYADHSALGGSPVEYQYFTKDGSGLSDVLTGRYPSNPSLCSSGYEGKLMYVEDRFADGDFRYAAGEIPTTDDERYWIAVSTDPETGKDVETDRFSPIWPDDYIFFGQKLTYGYSPSYAHQSVPTAVVRDGGRLSDEPDANRVYRAPAYYRNSTMGVAHFNPAAFLAQTQKDNAAVKAYPGMTAIDFAGHNDIVDAGGTRKAYQLGSVSSGFPAGSPAFYPPLLDDDGLTAISNCNETQNLLVYAPAAAPASEGAYANATTHTVLTSYFSDPAYTDYYDNNDGYRLVAENTATLYGHLVQSDLTATNDHFLVDRQDFNAPLAYTFDGSHRMWYQRKPLDAEFVDLTKGWQGISLPFTAELVTTDVKGEITHFYGGSASSANGTGSKIGHEYWLRSFNNIVEESGDAIGTFSYPSAGDGSTVVNKSVTNTFLWDYYYKNEPVHNQKDANADTYLQYRQYYNGTRTHASYPLLTAATPYLLGLPGQTYYEFDLSGKWEAKNTAVAITKLAKQTVTFASDAGITIGVSDTEMEGKKVTYSGTDYVFKPSYMNEQLENGSYVINSTGDAYVKLNSGHAAWITESEAHTFADDEALTTWMAANYKLYTNAEGTTEATTANNTEVTYYKRIGETTVNDTHHVTPAQSAFRPFFTATTSGGSVKRQLPSRIIFGATGDEFEQGPESALDGSLEIFARGRNIITRSHMTEPTTVRIVNIGGITITNFILQPGQTIETPVQAHGAYIVNKKKIFIH